MGAEYWGAFKNIIALACGVVDGLKADGRGGDNLKAAVFTAGYREAVRLLPELGAAMDTAFSPAGIGDSICNRDVTSWAKSGDGGAVGPRAVARGSRSSDGHGERGSARCAHVCRAVRCSFD